jgi:elongation factor G
MPRDLQTLRNIGIIAHIDAGKTTVTERMLFYSGAIHRMGDVDKGTTTTDFDPEEQQRGITIYSACVTFNWKGYVINLIDTPGHVDFTAEVERSLRVLDGGVVVFSAREGVEAQSETVWRQADKYHVPRVAFINKLDREGADFYGTLDEIRQRLDSNPVAIQIPVGAGPPHMQDAFRGIVDLVRMKLLTFTSESQGATVVEGDIPPEVQEDAELWRSQMLEQLFDYSNELAELVLAETDVPEDLVRKVIREATLHHFIVPVLCGSALDYVGIQPLLDAVAWYLPSPADVPPIEGANPKRKDAKEKRKPSVKEPLAALVFKIQVGRHGEMHFVRVYSGELEAGSRVLNPGKDKKEIVNQLWHIQADRREQQVEKVEAGDIVGVIGLKASITGDTICQTQHPIVLESIQFPETVISMAIEPESSAERKKLHDTLEMLKRQDPTLRTRESEETGQTLISGMGELHLEIVKHRLLRDFNLNVKVHKPRVSYRETIERGVEVTGECHRQVAGQTQFAKVRLKLEPFEAGEKPVTVVDATKGKLSEPYLDAVLEYLRERGDGGGSYGYPLLKDRATVLGGEEHETESNDIAFRVAAADGFNKGLNEAGTVILEPIMRVEVTMPEEYFGDFVSDLQQRRGTISQTHQRGNKTVIEARAPLAALFGYSNAMRSLSQGRATCTMEPSGYGPAPPEVLESLM